VEDVRVAVAGVGNCANCLIQGSEFLADQIDNPDIDWSAQGLLNETVMGYGPGSVRVVLGFDVDPRKVGLDLCDAMWAEPNVAKEFWRPESNLGPVLAGPALDGIGRSHREMVPDQTTTSVLIRDALLEHQIDVLVNFLPVGAEQASVVYAEEALAAGVAFVNAIPVWVARNDALRARFEAARVPLIGDDIKSQVGATILHRAIAEAFESRGAKIGQTYQLNFGGNTDFYNMKDEDRLKTKRESKTAAVTSVAEVAPDKIHIGPSGFVGFLEDQKIAFIQVKGTGFCGNELEVEVRYSGQDSPNSAGVVYDAVRWAAAAGMLPEDVPLDLLTVPSSAWLMKAPPLQVNDREAAQRCSYLASRSNPAELAVGAEDLVAAAAEERA
jgi:myo-inositol-1-phosphate synthase